jgi:hypothetical protein
MTTASVAVKNPETADLQAESQGVPVNSDFGSV